MQTTNKYVSPPPVLFCSNIDVQIAGVSETIVLDNIGALGFRNVAATIVNYTNSAGTISAVKLYGSPDGINYMQITSFSLVNIAAGNMGHTEITCIHKYLRLTITGASTSDVYLYCTP